MSVLLFTSILLMVTEASPGYTLLGERKMCRGAGWNNGGRWMWVYDLSVCASAVLADPSCSDDFFSVSLSNGNCWCVPAGTDCTSEYTQNSPTGMHDARWRNTYAINRMRLSHGSYGLLEVFHEGEWGTVCRHHFGEQDATVACRQLGFAEGTPVSFTYEGEADQPIWLDDLHCTGEETSLFDCPHNGWGINNCWGHYGDIGLTCSSPDMCCQAETAACRACSEGTTEDEWCQVNPGELDCPDVREIIAYDDCETITAISGGSDDSQDSWNLQCSDGKVVTEVAIQYNGPQPNHHNLQSITCCGLREHTTGTCTTPFARYNIPVGGETGVTDRWNATCPPGNSMIGFFDDDDQDFTDLDNLKCCEIACDPEFNHDCDPTTHLSLDECEVLDITDSGVYQCSRDYTLTALYDDPEDGTNFAQIRKMQCCAVTPTPTPLPSTAPSVLPSHAPSVVPTVAPSSSPSTAPTTSLPTYAPTANPSQGPTVSPSVTPTSIPTVQPSSTPSVAPSFSPTAGPSLAPTSTPSVAPSFSPTAGPSLAPTVEPSTSPSGFPTHTPTQGPSSSPSNAPSHAPTECNPVCNWDFDMQMTDLQLVLEEQTKENKANIDVLRFTVYQLCCALSESGHPGVMDCDSLMNAMPIA